MTPDLLRMKYYRGSGFINNRLSPQFIVPVHILVFRSELKNYESFLVSLAFLNMTVLCRHSAQGVLLITVELRENNFK